MERIDALKHLAAKVEAGEAGRQICRSLIWAAFGREFRVAGDPIGRIIDYILDPEDMRAMGAAKALMEAVLPGWSAVVGQNAHHLDWSAWARFAQDGEIIHETTAADDDPARGWLLAILRSLISMEEAK